MDWIESLRYIRDAKNYDKLVVFVGEGISKNSNIPTWRELINDIAEKINYSHCETCGYNDKCTEDYLLQEDIAYEA